MSLITLKAGVIVSKQVVIACAVVNAATVLSLPDMVITSGRDGAHMATSKHYVDQALDIRTKHLDDGQKNALVAAMRKRLGADYQLVLESRGLPSEHLHIEFDPV